MSRKNILVIGSSNVDMIIKTDQLPKLGQTVTNGIFVQTYGGKGANQAVGAARAGGKVSFVNCVGDDVYAEPMIDNFIKDGIDVSGIFYEKGISSGIALVMIGDQGQNYLSVAPGANYKLFKEHIDKVTPIIEASDLLLLQCEILPETLEYTIDKAFSLGKKIVLNLAPAREIDDQYLKKLNLLIVNESEAEFISGLPVETENQIFSAVDSILKKGCKNVIITLGAKGSYVADGESIVKIPAYKVEAVDTTAAGDVFCGCLCVALVEGKTLTQAVEFATAASAIAVTRLGAQPSAPSRAEIEAFINKAVASA